MYDSVLPPRGGIPPPAPPACPLEAEYDEAMAELEWATRCARAATADQWRMIADILRDAAEIPELWVGPDPTLGGDWTDPQGRSAAVVRRDRQEFAVRAAASDVAVRLRLAESTVRTRAVQTATLRERCPRVWEAFRFGEIAEAHAVTTAQLALSLPDDSPDAWAEFDARVCDLALRLAPARFGGAARAVRERVHHESIDDRHRRASVDRGVWLTPELDGMATLTALVPAVAGAALLGRLDAAAAHLRAGHGEERTLAQLRADVLCDLGAGTSGAAVDKGVPARATVAVTIPALSLLGASDEPATLAGYGPIDLDTARTLAGRATSWIRVLTHPLTGAVLDVDRTTYRVPADLGRWLGVRHSHCVFPGCGRSSAACDLDHSVDWQFGGTTAADNLAPLCRSHHRLKHETRWKLDRRGGRLRWTSPTGMQVEHDPPPF